MPKVVPVLSGGDTAFRRLLPGSAADPFRSGFGPASGPVPGRSESVPICSWSGRAARTAGGVLCSRVFEVIARRMPCDSPAAGGVLFRRVFELIARRMPPDWRACDEGAVSLLPPTGGRRKSSPAMDGGYGTFSQGGFLSARHGLGLRGFGGPPPSTLAGRPCSLCSASGWSGATRVEKAASAVETPGREEPAGITICICRRRTKFRSGWAKTTTRHPQRRRHSREWQDYLANAQKDHRRSGDCAPKPAGHRWVGPGSIRSGGSSFADAECSRIEGMQRGLV